MITLVMSILDCYVNIMGDIFPIKFAISLIALPDQFILTIYY